MSYKLMLQVAVMLQGDVKVMLQVMLQGADMKDL